MRICYSFNAAFECTHTHTTLYLEIMYYIWVLSSFDAKLAIKSLPRLLSKIVIASILKQFETFIQFLCLLFIHIKFILFCCVHKYYIMEKRRLLKYLYQSTMDGCGVDLWIQAYRHTDDDKHLISKRRNVVAIKNIITL